MIRTLIVADITRITSYNCPSHMTMAGIDLRREVQTLLWYEEEGDIENLRKVPLICYQVFNCEGDPRGLDPSPFHKGMKVSIFLERYETVCLTSLK